MSWDVVAGNLYETASGNRQVRITHVGIEEIQGVVELDRSDPDSQGEVKAWTHDGFKSHYTRVWEGNEQPAEDGTPATVSRDEVQVEQMGEVEDPEGTEDTEGGQEPTAAVEQPIEEQGSSEEQGSLTPPAGMPDAAADPNANLDEGETAPGENDTDRDDSES